MTDFDPKLFRIWAALMLQDQTLDSLRFRAAALLSCWSEHDQKDDDVVSSCISISSSFKDTNILVYVGPKSSSFEINLCQCWGHWGQAACLLSSISGGGRLKFCWCLQTENLSGCRKTCWEVSVALLPSRGSACTTDGGSILT